MTKNITDINLFNDSQIAGIVGHSMEVQFGLYQTANERAIVAIRKLAAHRLTGASRVDVVRDPGDEYGDIDYFIELSDTRGQGAAMSIEFGRRTKHGRSNAVGALRAAMEG